MARLVECFESEPCSRCGGSGNYSFNQRDGSTCFACGFKPYVPGSGYSLTRLGRAAHAAYVAANTDTIPVTSLQPGDLIRHDQRLRRVERVEPSDTTSTLNGVVTKYISVHFANSTVGYGFYETSDVERWTQRIPLPEATTPGTDREAEMKALIESAEAVTK